MTKHKKKRTKEHRNKISESNMGRIVSDETKRKIGNANKGIWIDFKCDYCGVNNSEKKSHYDKKRRHFCNIDCYSLYRIHIMPKEEQNAYKGGGMSDKERKIRIAARTILNHAIGEKRMIRPGKCSCCDSTDNIEAHHEDYSKPLDVIWLSRKCHKKIHEHPELLKEKEKKK